MAFRTVVIKNRCKLEYSLNYLVCRGEEEKRVLIDEIETIIIQNIGVSLTCALLSALIERKVKVIFCDSKSNPQSELMPYFNNYSNYKKIKQQISYSEDIKNKIWQLIIHQKIYYQMKVLQHIKHNSFTKLQQYLEEIQIGDFTNREGHAAKVYFNSIFGNEFSRGDDFNLINKYLNFGYSILVSAINREIKILGYLTELGIHHIGETNPFNLSYDIVEPLRPLVDIQVVTNKVNDDNYKDYFIKMLSSQVLVNGHKMFLDNAIHLYVQSLFSALNNENIKEVLFIEYEL